MLHHLCLFPMQAGMVPPAISADIGFRVAVPADARTSPCAATVAAVLYSPMRRWANFNHRGSTVTESSPCK